MSVFKKPLQWLLMRNTLQITPRTQMFHSSQGILYNRNKRLDPRQSSFDSSQKKRPYQQKFKEQHGWAKKMHESLIKDVRLPLPDQGGPFLGFTQLQCCSLDSLLSMVWDVIQVDHDTTELLIELWRRMDSMSTEQIISVADIFFINNVQASWYLSAMTVYILETFDITEFTPSQLTRLTFHALDRHRSTPPGFCLALEDIIFRSVDSLSLNELAIICHSFFTSQTRIRSMDLLDKISIKLIQELDSLNSWYLPLFMKTLRYSNFIKISFYKELGDLLIEKDYLEGYRTLAQIMHIAFTYASVRVSHPALFSYILQTCCHPKYSFRLKDLSTLIWACGTLVTDHQEDVLAIQRIVTYLEYNLSLAEVIKHPDNLVDLVSGLCFIGVYNDFMLNTLFNPKSVAAIIGVYVKLETILSKGIKAAPN